MTTGASGPGEAPVGFDIAGRGIGDGYPCFVIAEVGVNHNGDPAIAKRSVEAAAAAGADAVKFQTFRAEALVTASAPKAEYQLGNTDAAESQLDMLKALQLSVEEHRELMALSVDRGVLFLSTPFDRESADLLEELDLPAFKIGSGELTDLPLLRHVARKGRPLIVSTGMSWLAEVEAAVETIRAEGAGSLGLLHCVSNYPAAPGDLNLAAMATLRRTFGVPVGYSDHTTGLGAAVAAVALGACIIEKHFTVDRSLPGPDHRVSLEPSEFREMVNAIRATEASIGDGAKRPMPAEESTRLMARKSVVALQRIESGTVITPDMVGVRRPGTGLAPAELDRVAGRRAGETILPGTPLTEAMLA